MSSEKVHVVTDLPESKTEESPKKKFALTKKQMIIAGAAVTGVAAAVLVGLKVKNGDFKDLSVGELLVTEVPTTALEA